MMRKIVLSLIASLGLCSLALAQNKQVSGTVTDADGMAAIGASVVVDGTTVGTTTNTEGKFTITAPANATLVVTYLGYETQKVPVAGRTALQITLQEDTTNIEDVVVLGYGSGRKVGTVIGSVDQVKGDKLENRPSNNVADALQGQVAGLSVMTGNGELTTTSTIRVHGVGSISASTAPLILLDGAPISSTTLLSLNQNDIEAINVLKDASATSIYGSRAANGVIYVTTKRGRRGSDDVNVTLRTQYSMSSTIKPRLKAMNTEDYLYYMGALYAAASGTDPYNPDDILDGRSMFINDFGVDPSINTNWFDELMEKNAPMYQIDLSVAGGSQKTSYFFSGNYLDQTGTMPGSKLSRYNFRANVDTKVNKWLKMGVNLGIGYQDATSAPTNSTMGALYTVNPLFGSLLLPSYQPCYDANGQLIEWLGVAGGQNPLVIPKYYPHLENQIYLNGSGFVELTPVRGLTLRSQLSASAFDNRSSSYYSPAMPQSSGPEGTGSAAELFERTYTWTWTNTAEYKTAFGQDKDHHFTALLGEETIYTGAHGFSAAVRGVTSTEFINLNMGTESDGLPSYSRSQFASNSVFGRVEYDYANRYFFDVALRNDASSRFAKDDRNALFWSVGAMWNIKNEAFLRDNMTITDLSLRASYGTQGNSGIADYAFYQYLAPGSPYDGQTSWGLANPGNPSLSWEKQGLLTIGVDIELWRKLSLEVQYYRRQTTDMLMDVPQAPSSGFTSLPGNVGGMRNSGIDVTLNYDIYASRDWFVNFHANFNYNKNTLTKMWPGAADVVAFGSGLYFVKGEAYPAWYMQEWRGVDPETGYSQWTAADGGVTNDYSDAVPVDLHKSLIAPYTGGFGFTVQWKGLALTADFAWVAGNYLFNNNLYFAANINDAMGGNNQVYEVLDYWKPDDRYGKKYPSLDYAINNPSGGTQFDSRMLEDASFLRLKNIQIAYTLPDHLMKKTRFIKGLKVYVGARNLWTVTGYNGFDPEASGSNYFDADVYPNTRQWTFGLEFKF